MKLSISLLVPAFIGAATAASNANAYIFQGGKSITNSNPTFTPEQARLVLAQRLGASKYHGLAGASEKTLSYINIFGGEQESLFQDAVQDKPAELVLIVEGTNGASLFDSEGSIEPTFTISNPPSMKANKQLVKDLNQQLGQTRDCKLEDAINPYETKCWTGKSKVIHYDLGDKKDDSKTEELLAAKKRLSSWATKNEMNTILVLMPSSSRSSKHPAKPYGIYDTSSQANLGRRQASEEIISEIPVATSPPVTSLKQIKASNSTSKNHTLVGPQKVCHKSLSECEDRTNNCSGHGTCYKKYGTKDAGCFTCGCVAHNETIWGNPGDPSAPNKIIGHRIVSYGGPACSKRDVSGPFWLITVFTIVMIGLVSWAIGMLFSIGEEKLPGVIGAGVSSKPR